MKEQDSKHAAEVQQIREAFAKDFKRQKEAWATVEKAKRERWQLEKAREIKEMTTKGLEPELIKLVTDHNLQIENLAHEHALAMRKFKQETEFKFESQLVFSK